MLEKEYQAYLIKKIRTQVLPGSVVLKNDTQYRQGIPDLTVLYYERWGVLEVKASATAPERPNQDYYIDLLDGMSYAAFIFPENEQEILYELQQSLSPKRSARLSKS